MGGPSGTVTFLFTDIERSTWLWEHDPDAMNVALERHDKAVRGAVAEHGGSIFATGGDGFAVAFSRAVDAIEAAVDAQHALASLESPVPLLVRMGIHTGDVIERGGDYFGPTVNRAARLMAAAHGGQVLASSVTLGLAADRLPDGVKTLDLGTHRLRDLALPEHVHQVVVPDGIDAFPAIRSLDAFPGNLPLSVTGFVGRDKDLVDLAATVRTARVVTLTGVGGVGKTRLALQVAADVIPEFRDGAWVVELQGVGGDDSVAEAVAATLGISTGPAGGGRLVEQLCGKELLLVVDNCEHLLAPVASLVEEVVRTAPGVRVLATSREGLGVAGEHIHAVASLGLPDRAADASEVAASEAVQLFVERAREASANYVFADEQASAVADLCRRLDGIPLAIELAAARVPALTPAEIGAHLDQRFKLLTGGRRTAVSRHQTLRAAIDWSYQLLDADEQSVLDCLSVFSGGFDLAAAGAVASNVAVDEFEVIDAVARLVGKSLVVAEAGEGTTRYRLLETVRDFAWDKLQERGDATAMTRRHAEHFAAFAHDAGAGLMSEDEATWRRRIVRDIDNLRAAVMWAISVGDVDLALGPIADLSILGDTVAPYGLLGQEAARLAEDDHRAPIALASAAFSAVLQGDIDLSWDLVEEAGVAAERLERTREGLYVRCRVANASAMTRAYRSPDVVEFARRWLADARELADPWCLCEALTLMMNVEFDGLALGEEALALARTIGAPSRFAFVAVFLAAQVAVTDPERADALLSDAAAAGARSGNEWVEHVTALSLVQLYGSTGDWRKSASIALAAAERSRSAGIPGNAVQFIGMIGYMLVHLGDAEVGFVLIEWSDTRGQPFAVNSYNLAAFHSDVIAERRAQLSLSEQQRIARAAAALDDVAVIEFVRERLAAL